MIPTFLARASTLLFNQLWLWWIHQCVPSFQPGPVLSLLPGIPALRKDPSRLFLPTYSGPIFPTATLLHALASPHDLQNPFKTHSPERRLRSTDSIASAQASRSPQSLTACWPEH